MYCKRQQSVEALHKGGWVKQGTEGGQRAKHATCHMSRTEKVLLLSKRKTRAMKRGLLLGSGLALCPLALQESRALDAEPLDVEALKVSEVGAGLLACSFLAHAVCAHLFTMS